MFKGLARRDGIVPPEIVLRDYATPMYGKKVRLLNISLERDSLPDEIVNDALTLIPSILRERETAADVTQPEEQAVETTPSWQSVVQETTPKRGTRLRERMRVDVTRPPPRPKGSDRFIDTLDRNGQDRRQGTRITRAWQYDLAPKQFPDEENEKLSVTHPPLAAALDAGEIDTIETREKELTRLLYATRHLLGQSSVSRQLQSCCAKIERYCAKRVFLIKDDPSLRTPQFFLGALSHVQSILLQNEMTREVWKRLVPLRQGLADLLNSENRETVKDTLAQVPDLFLLYGNNLFLALMSVVNNKSSPYLETLWPAIADWTFYQLGLTIQDETVKPLYSFHAILANLRSRVKTLAGLSLPKATPTREEQVGVIYWQEDESGYDGLLLIPKDGGGFITGVVHGLRNKWLPSRWLSCRATRQDLKAFAEKALSSTDFTPVTVSKQEGEYILYIPVQDENDDSIQWASFSFEHGKPGGRYDSIPWLKLEATISEKIANAIPNPSSAIVELLSQMARIKLETIAVHLIVDVDKEQEVYEVDLDGAPFSERLTFSRTDDLVSFLRTPVRSGMGYRTQRKAITWDHREDIEYGEGLTFLKPLVNRSWFFPDSYHYPVTCRELLQARIGEQVSLVVHPDGSEFRVELPDSSTTSCLKKLEGVGLSPCSLGLLAECEELYDYKTRTFHPVELDVIAIMDAKLWDLHRYPRLQEAMQSVDESKFDWSQDIWEFEGSLGKGSEITWLIRSSLTSRVWRGSTFSFHVSQERSADELIEELRESIAQIAPLDALNGLEGVLENFKALMLGRGWHLTAGSEVVFEEEADEWDAEEHEETCEVQEKAKVGLLVEEGDTYHVTAVEVSWTRGEMQLLVSLESEHGNMEEVAAVSDCGQLLHDSQFAGAISQERVNREVHEHLALYGIDGYDLKDAQEAVRDALSAEGVRFYDD